MKGFIVIPVLLFVAGCGTLGYQPVPTEGPADPQQQLALHVGQQVQETVESVLPNVVTAAIGAVEKFASGAGWMKAPVAPVLDEAGQPKRDEQGRIIWDWQPAAGILGVLGASMMAWWRSKRWAEVKTDEVNKKRKDLAQEHYALERRVRDMEVKNGGGLSDVGGVAGSGAPG